MKLKILYIDDERVNLSNFELAFEDEFKTATFLEPGKALDWIDENPDVAVVISDQRIDVGTGLQLLEQVYQKVPAAVRILVNSYVITDEIEAAVESGLICRCIQKPWNADEFAFTIRQVSKNYLLARKNEELQEKLSQAESKLLAVQRELEQHRKAAGAGSSASSQAVAGDCYGCRPGIDKKKTAVGYLAEEAVNAKGLTGMLDICASCKKVRDDQGVWKNIEIYIEQKSGVHFNHGICGECIKHVCPELDVEKYSKSFV